MKPGATPVRLGRSCMNAFEREAVVALLAAPQSELLREVQRVEEALRAFTASPAAVRTQGDLYDYEAGRLSALEEVWRDLAAAKALAQREASATSGRFVRKSGASSLELRQGRPTTPRQEEVERSGRDPP